MTQRARPVADVTVSGWSPTPVYAALNEADPDDNSRVESNSDPQGDTFEARLAGLAPPGCGPGALTVRLKQTAGGSAEAVVALLEGRRVVAAGTFTPGPSFADCTLALGPAALATVRDWADLRVRVVAGRVASPCCEGESVPALLRATFAGSGGCSCAGGAGADLLWDPATGRWHGEGSFPAGCGGTAYTLDVWCCQPGQEDSWCVSLLGGCVRPYDPVLASCSPFLLTTRPATFGPPCCPGDGSLAVTVTEAP